MSPEIDFAHERTGMTDPTADLIDQVKACRICAEKLPHCPRPVIQIGREARLLIAGQAPGSKVHETGIPFDDPSGDTLRAWLGIDKATFYDPSKVAILPMAFCYPAAAKAAISRHHRNARQHGERGFWRPWRISV